MAGPSLRPMPPAPERKPLDVQAALASSLRTWLVFRDTLLWNFCAGAEPGIKLPLIDADGVAAQIVQLNQQREAALALAKQIADMDGERTAQGVFNQALAELLAGEAPMFSLALAQFTGSF